MAARAAGLLLPLLVRGTSLLLGRLSSPAGGARGLLSAAGPSALLLSGFTYDGLGTAVFFLAGTSAHWLRAGREMD
jgi:hypothetical protein